MPYKVFQDGDQFCVHKLNADDSMDERVKGGCHPTRAEAMQHKEALYVHVEDAKGGPASGWQAARGNAHRRERAQLCRGAGCRPHLRHRGRGAAEGVQALQVLQVRGAEGVAKGQPV